MANYKYIYIGLVFLLVTCAVFVALFFYNLKEASNSQATATQAQIADGFRTVKAQPTFAENDQNLQRALQGFVTIAADENNLASQRAQALNGIYYAYTASNSDAKAIRDTVFSHPYFASYYVASSSRSSVDPVRPESGAMVEPVELALAKILALSNELSPNHYAVSRLETAELFAYDRAVARIPVSKRQSIKEEYAAKVKNLIATYDSLPPLDSQDNYLPAMRMQVMYLHASALEFVGEALNDQAYVDRGSALYEKIFQMGASYPRTNEAARGVLNQTLFARIFYATHYWRHYKDTEPSRIKDALRPLLDEEANKGLSVYEQYLPSRKNANSGPSWVLRDIAKQMPELKTFLAGRGWKF